MGESKERKVVRVSLDMSPLLRAPLKVAAAHHSKTMRAYIVDAVMEKLASEKIKDYEDMSGILKNIKKEEKILRQGGEW